MANYSDIKGFTVQTLSTDTIASQAAGGSWASGGSLNTARSGSGGTGTTTSALVFGGYPGSGFSATNESYNGSSFTEVADINSARRSLMSAGIANTAALAIAGYQPPGSVTNKNESWDGSSWTEIADVNTARSSGSSAGIQTAALLFTGAPTPTHGLVESWNGSSWTEVAEVNTARAQGGGAGTYTDAVLFGGYAYPPGSKTSNTEIWNGSSWTETGDMNTTRSEDIGSAGRASTDVLGFGGYTTTVVANTEAFNGSSWTEVNDLSTARYNGCRGPSGLGEADAIWAGGASPSIVGNTEEWTAPSDFVQIHEGQLFFNSTTNTFKETITDIPPTTWASGGNLNTGRNGSGGAGIQTASLVFGGGTPDATGATEQYDGSAWTEVNDLNTARKGLFNGLGLSYSAAICTGGLPAPGG